MKKAIFVLLILCGLFGAAQEETVFAGDSCDELSSQLVAKTYVLTMPLLGKDNKIIPLMEKYPGHFAQGGGAIRCMQSLGNALMRGALEQSREFSRPYATERFGGSMPEGLGHLPGQVDRSMISYGNDMFTMGQELLWLAEVLPYAAQGNYAPYNNPTTTNRQMAAQVLPIYQMMCQMDPSVCQMMVAMLEELSPQIEQQILFLARQLGN